MRGQDKLPIHGWGRRELMGLVDEGIVDYTLAHTTALAEPLRAVADATQRDSSAPTMMSGLVEARLLQMLVAATDARIALEVGTFTGFGALALAAAMPDDGRVITVEYNGELAAIARANIQASPYADRIELIIGDAREVLRDLAGPFDVVYLDAWKDDYVHYYEALLPRLAPRGVIAADNVLWQGRVVDPDEEDDQAQAIAAFNAHVQADPRTTNTILSVGDGVLLAWRTPAGQS
jgi:caffeoyl-CoA O-methyltransferase